MVIVLQRSKQIGQGIFLIVIQPLDITYAETLWFIYTKVTSIKKFVLRKHHTLVLHRLITFPIYLEGLVNIHQDSLLIPIKNNKTYMLS